MSKFKIILSPNYEKRLSEIEDYIFESSQNNLKSLETFLEEHHKVLDFIKEHPFTPYYHPLTGDRSWPFNEGRHRVFFKVDKHSIYLLDLIDNKMSNEKFYPITTYDE